MNNSFEVNWENIVIVILLLFTLLYFGGHVIAWIIGGKFPN